MRPFLDELKRRNVVRVGFAYLVVGWLVAQIAELVLPTFDAPGWVLKTVFFLIALGFPLALLFAWAYELTPQGLMKTSDVDENESVTHSTGRRLNLVIIGALAIALAYFVWDRQRLIAAGERAAAAVSATAPAPGSAEGAAQPVGDDSRSIAVLPFVNMSSDDEQEWFADGLTEELLNSLARTPDLLVASRTSSFVYKGSIKTVPEIAGELGVDHVLEGSVRRSGDRLRVTAQLIRAADGFHLWSETYDRTLDDVIAIQEDVAIEIANALETALDPEALAAMMSAGTRSVPAYESYLQGLAYGVSTQVTGDIYEFLGARDAFERALELDPGFSKAWWELARFWAIQLNTTNIVSGITGQSHDDMLVQFEKAIDRAIETETDPISTLGYRAVKATQEMNLSRAQRLREEYLAARPNDIEAQISHIIGLNFLRRFVDAEQAAQRLLQQEVRDPELMSQVIQNLRYSDNRELQREFAELVFRRFPDNVNILYQAHRMLLTMGDIDGASRIVPAILNSDMPASSRFLVRLRQACAEQRRSDADEIVAAYRASGDVDVESRSIVWLTYKILGDDAAAEAYMRELDDAGEVRELFDYVGYGAFDPKRFPNLMAAIADQGVGVDTVYEIPYRCGR